MPSAHTRLDWRTIWAWALYDFGNSSFAVLFASLYSVYYSEQVVKPTGGPADLLWGATIGGSMLAVALSSPFVGGISDHTGRRKLLLAVYTLLGILAVLSLVGIGPGWVLLASLCAALANFAFEGAMVFYNAYLPEIAPASHRGRVSAVGFAVGYAGSLVALGVAYPLVKAEAWHWLWVAIAVQWAVFALPAFWRLPPDRPKGLTFMEAGRQGFRQTAQTIRDVWGMKNLRWFLIAFFFYMDGVITVVYFAARYARKTLEFDSVQLIGMLAIVQVTALLGSLLMAKPTDIKGPRWTVRLLLGWWVAVVVVTYFTHDKTLFFVVAAMAGLGLGSIQAASRALLARLIPPGRESELFGFYALCGKSGSILGPVVFGAVAALAGGDQRPAVLVVALFYAIGFILLARVDDRPVAET